MSGTEALTRGGKPWTPSYVEAIDSKVCIGCGRCYKVCPRDVLTLVDRGDDDIDDDWDDEDAKALMTVKDPMDCIGCGACGRTCPKNCFTFVN